MSAFLMCLLLHSDVSDVSGRLEIVAAFHHPRATCIAVSPDGRILASAAVGEVRLWDLATAKELVAFDVEKRVVYCLVFSIDGSRLFGGLGPFSVRGQTVAPAGVAVWDVAERKPVTTISTDRREVMSLAVSPEGTRLASEVGIFDARTLQALVKLKEGSQGGGQVAVAYHPMGKLIATGQSDSTVRLCDPATAKMLAILGKPKSPEYYSSFVSSVAFSPKGDVLAAGTGKYHDGKACQLDVWDVEAKQLKFTLEHQSAGILSVAFSPDGVLLISAYNDGHLKVWDPRTGKELARHKLEAPALCVAFDPTGRFLAVGRAGKEKNLLLIKTASLLKGTQKP